MIDDLSKYLRPDLFQIYDTSKNLDDLTPKLNDEILANI